MCAKLMGIVFGVMVLFLLSGLAQAATVECDSCDDCNAKVAVAANGDLILMNASFSTTATCIGFPEGANNITLDCQGNTVWGSNDACIVGIGSYQTFYNTIQNCNFYGFDGAGIVLDTCAYWSVINSSFRWGNFTGYCGGVGLNLIFSQLSNFTNLDLSDNAFGFGEAYACDNNTFTNITANRNIYGNGISLGSDTKYNVFNGIEANDNNGIGMLVTWASNYNTFSNLTMNGNVQYGLYVMDSSYNIFTDFRISDSGSSGIYFDDGGGSSVGNLFYDGIINNSVNYMSVDLDNANSWNVTPFYGLNIIGGAKVGGNWWSGYSETCSSGNGFCDVPLVLDGSNTDYYPLRNHVTNDTAANFSLSLMYSPYAAVGDTVEIHAYVIHSGSAYDSADVFITLDNATVTMAWDNVSGSYVVFWIPSSNGDYVFNVTAFAWFFRFEDDGLIKVRTPFNITVRLWNNINMTAGSEYRNEFAWIYLTKDLDPTLHVLFGRDKFTCPPEGVDECYWHGKYVNGTAVITLYESGNYTMYILGNNIEWYLMNPSGVSMPCAFCPPVKTQSRFLLNLGNYYLDTAEDFDLYYSETELYYVGGFFGMFASWLNMFIFVAIGFVAFIVVLLATGSLKSALAVLIILPSIIWILTHLVLW
jgi:hypothetical protein